MLHHKFERYISQNTPQAALALVKSKANIIPLDYKGKPATGNALYSLGGLTQRDQIEPKNYNLNKNKDRIGKNIRQSFGPSQMGILNSVFMEQSMKRKITCFQAEINHMQCTPYVRRGYWQMQYESIGFYRSHGMHWARCSEDAYKSWGNRDEMCFINMEAAVTQARKLGAEVDIVYPHERYHTQKAYADNFVYSKEAVSDAEEDDIVDQFVKKMA